MLEIENLTKTFGTQTVISDISMTLVSGKIYGLVGRNGSGKTMLMKMILGFVSPSSGSIKIEGKVLGKDISMPDRIGAIIENPGFLPEYSGFKNLKFLAMIHHKISNEEIRNAMRIVGLDPDSKKHVGKYSLGMRQRLGIAQAIMEDPDILLLDEPTSHLDTYSQLALEQAIEKYEGAVLMVSHDFYTVANCMDYVLFVEEKKLRKMSIRKFRKMIYADHFDKNYLELEQKKKELENRISFALQTGKFEEAGKYCDDLEQIINQM